MCGDYKNMVKWWLMIAGVLVRVDGDKNHCQPELGRDDARFILEGIVSSQGSRFYGSHIAREATQHT